MLWLLVKRGVSATQMLLRSLGSTAGLTPAQTQLSGEQPWSKTGFVPPREMKQDLGLRALAMLYLHPSPDGGTILNC